MNFLWSSASAESRSCRKTQMRLTMDAKLCVSEFGALSMQSKDSVCPSELRYCTQDEFRGRRRFWGRAYNQLLHKNWSWHRSGCIIGFGNGGLRGILRSDVESILRATQYWVAGFWRIQN